MVARLKPVVFLGGTVGRWGKKYGDKVYFSLDGMPNHTAPAGSVSGVGRDDRLVPIPRMQINCQKLSSKVAFTYYQNN